MFLLNYLTYFIDFLMILIIMNFMLMFKFKSNFLMMLISLEFLVMNVILLIFYYEMFCNEWIFLFYMIFSVCESVIGLSLLINMIYIYGNQSILFLNLMW